MIRERGYTVRNFIQEVPLSMSRILNKQVSNKTVLRMNNAFSRMEINWSFDENGIVERGLFQEGFKVP